MRALATANPIGFPLYDSLFNSVSPLAARMLAADATCVSSRISLLAHRAVVNDPQYSFATKFPSRRPTHEDMFALEPNTIEVSKAAATNTTSSTQDAFSFSLPAGVLVSS